METTKIGFSSGHDTPLGSADFIGFSVADCMLFVEVLPVFNTCSYILLFDLTRIYIIIYIYLFLESPKSCFILNDISIYISFNRPLKNILTFQIFPVLSSSLVPNIQR